MNDFLIDHLKLAISKTSTEFHNPGPVITISRDCGCSAKRIATKLSKILTGYNYNSETKTEVEWKWVSKEIIEKITANLNEKDFDSKNLNSELLVDDLKLSFSGGKFYDSSDLKVVETVQTVIRGMVNHGHYIIVGLAGNVIAQDIPNRLCIKLQAPFDWRVNRIMQLNNLSWEEARTYVLSVDSKRDRFVESVAGRQINNNDYDVIFNYSTMPDDHIVDAIVNILKNNKMILNIGCE